MSDTDALNKYKPIDKRFAYAQYPFYWIARASNLYSQRMEKVLKKSSVTMTGWRICMVLKEHKSLSVSKLSLHCSFNLSTVTKTVYSMQARGLLLISQSETDGRVTKVTLTDQGQVLIAQLIEDTSRIINAVIEGMTEEEILQMNVLLQKITVSLSD